MTDVKQLITEYLDIWLTAETEKKSGRGRSSGANSSIYGVQKLRELILDLAIRGKLILQNIQDEPASELLKKIHAERKQLIKDKIIRKPKPLPELDTFNDKRGWITCYLLDIGDWGAGATPPRGNTEFYGGNIPWFKSGELTADYISISDETVTPLALEKCSLRLNKPNDVLIAMYGATIGKTAITSVESTTNQAVCACTLFGGFLPKYLLTFLKAKKNYFIGMGAGGAQPNISREKLIETIIEVPPLEEQHRIVAKVDELMQLCDQLEQQQNLSTEAHEQLVDVLLNALTNSADADEFQQNWQRISANFDLLFTTDYSIEQLKQMILQLAVMGKLVKQDPSDEPASELLKQIAEEKAKLVKEGKIKKSTKKYSDPELEVNLPNNWLISVMNHLIFELDAGWSPACHSYPANHNNWGVLKTTAVQCNQFIENENKELPENLSPRQDAELKAGDILVTRAGPYNRVGVACYVEKVRPKLMISDKLIRIKYSQNHLDGTFIALAINFGQTALFLKENQSGMAESQVNISQDKLRSAPILLPPLLEQKRIVEKVNQLFSIIDQLRVLQTKARQTQLHLADVLVANAVEGA